HEESIGKMLDQAVTWSVAMKTLTTLDPQTRGRKRNITNYGLGNTKNERCPLKQSFPLSGTDGLQTGVRILLSFHSTIADTR
ncbi:MAG: hypothetical protein KJZ83_20505, partial [Burkholderiaceae bacterium]|nr:hypothetical protein [Burkholderiaceae bacterium]